MDSSGHPNQANYPGSGYGQPPPGAGYQGQMTVPSQQGYQNMAISPQNPPMSQQVPPQGYQNMMMMQQQQAMFQQAAMQQPQIPWMIRPAPLPGVPPGLEYLTQIDQLLIKQQIELFEALSGYETNNKYVVKNSLGQKVFFAKEDTDFCVRNCCGSQRPFTIHVMDNLDQEVIQILRPYKCMCYGQCFSCLACCQDEVEVQAPPGTTIGYVKELYEGCDVRYSVSDALRKTVLRIHGPSYFNCYCPGDDIPFQLMSLDGSVEVGRVSKQWTNLMKEWFTDADNFGIQFPMDLDVKMKAVILGAVFLIDFMFFERNPNQQRRYH